MNKKILGTLLLACGIAVAQEATTTTASTSDVRGCISSSSEGSYSLTDASGKVFKLNSTEDLKMHVGHTVSISGEATGDNYKVSKLTMISESCNPKAADTMSSTDTVASAPAAPATTATTATAGSNNLQSSPATTTTNSNMATSAPVTTTDTTATTTTTPATSTDVSNQSASTSAASTPPVTSDTSSASASATTPSSDQNAAMASNSTASSNDTASAQSTDTAQNTGAELPQTGSELPLLGLMGFGSLAAAYAARKK